jgi:hypothetical protein
MRYLAVPDDLFDAVAAALTDARDYRVGECSGLDDPDIDPIDKGLATLYDGLIEAVKQPTVVWVLRHENRHGGVDSAVYSSREAAATALAANESYTVEDFEIDPGNPDAERAHHKVLAALDLIDQT